MVLGREVGIRACGWGLLEEEEEEGGGTVCEVKEWIGRLSLLSLPSLIIISLPTHVYIPTLPKGDHFL